MEDEANGVMQVHWVIMSKRASEVQRGWGYVRTSTSPLLVLQSNWD